MTFSICVRETYEVERDENGRDDLTDATPVSHTRYGVAVTTRLPGVGTLCPFANEHGAVATQSLVNVDLGRSGIEYLADGLGVEDALQALLNADEGQSERQLHGVGRDGEFAFSGEDCREWYGDHVGENYTVAGNLLTGEEVLAETAAAYEGGDRSEPLAKRLIDALAAGHTAGGDRREDLPVQSAALKVTTTEDRDAHYYEDLRVDATETPLQDLRETYEEAKRGQELALAKYADEG